MRLTRRAAEAAAMALVAALVLVAFGADTGAPPDDTDEPEEGADGPVEAAHSDPRKHGINIDRIGLRG